jgi:hypothetical protein
MNFAKEDQNHGPAGPATPPDDAEPELSELSRQRSTITELLDLHQMGEPVSWPYGFDPLVAQSWLDSFVTESGMEVDG